MKVGEKVAEKREGDGERRGVRGREEERKTGGNISWLFNKYG